MIVESGLGEMVYIKKKNAWQWLPNTPVVKGRGDVFKEKDPEAATEAYGVDNFIPKPFSTEQLIEIIDATIEEKWPNRNKDEEESLSIEL